MQLQFDKSKRLRYLLFAGFGVVLLSSAIYLLVFTLDDSKPPTQDDVTDRSQAPADDAISLDDYLNGNFSAKYFNGSWWSETELQWQDKEGNLVAWNFETNETSVIVSKDLLVNISSSGTKFRGFSPDNSMILFSYDSEQIWRHSSTARYLVLDTTTNKQTLVTTPSGGERLRYCDWMENDEDENRLVYVYENNLYWRGNAVVGDDDVQITDDGETDSVFNGVPDWVYEEEILGTNYAHYISPSGNIVAYAQFNDTLVKIFNYPHYGDPNDILNDKYPTYRTVRYPKSGEVNPTATLFVRNLEAEQNKEVRPPAEVLNLGEYIYTSVTWASDDAFSVVWMNRIQNESYYCKCLESESFWDCTVEHEYKQPNGWIEPATPKIFNDNGTRVVTIEPHLENDGRYYDHLIMIEGSESYKLTEGKIVVTDVLAWDEDTETVYFMATRDNIPGTRHLYKVDDSGRTFIVCLTCDLEGINGMVCEYNDVDINYGNTHYVHTCRGKDIPEVNLRKLTDGSIIFTLEDNADLHAKLQSKKLPERIDTEVAVGDFMAPVKMMLPTHMTPGEKYPMLVYVYGGPGSQMVDYRWSVGWGDYLATTKNVIYVSIDGRGTGFQSNDYKFQVYRNLGTVEMQDQINVTRRLINNYDFIDAENVAIWGWSYGGFATAMTLEADTGPAPVFSCGISVAPVTSWLLYDSMYTERFMATPAENPAGYNNSVVAGIENLRGKKWMLNHGVADDNVHYQHSMFLTKALERADIQFEQHSYPDENHSLSGVRRFLYHAMDTFWTKCFNL